MGFSFNDLNPVSILKKTGKELQRGRTKAKKNKMQQKFNPVNLANPVTLAKVSTEGLTTPIKKTVNEARRTGSRKGMGAANYITRALFVSPIKTFGEQLTALKTGDKGVWKRQIGGEIKKPASIYQSGQSEDAQKNDYYRHRLVGTAATVGVVYAGYQIGAKGLLSGGKGLVAGGKTAAGVVSAAKTAYALYDKKTGKPVIGADGKQVISDKPTSTNQFSFWKFVNDVLEIPFSVFKTPVKEAK